jgi:predicted PurR-regulated permease PerM
LILFFVVAIPVTAFLSLVVRQAVSISDEAIPWLKSHFGADSSFRVHDWLVHKFPKLSSRVPTEEKLVENVGIAAKSASVFLVAIASKMTAGTAAFVLNLLVMVYAMFFFFRDGDKILEKILYYLPLSHEEETVMLQRFSSITRATLKGTLVVGIVQGTLAGLAFRVVGIEGAAFWGTMMAILSVIPGIGAALIWLPAVIYLCASGHLITGILLFLWCSAAIGTIDNLLRPTLVGKDSKMPDLLILVGTLGGLFLFGPIGFIVGPIVCGLFLTIWEIYGATFRDVLPPVNALNPVKGEQELVYPAQIGENDE